MSDPRPQDDDQQEDQTAEESPARESRATGGDAPAAGSVAEREAVAKDEDDAWGAGGRSESEG